MTVIRHDSTILKSLALIHKGSTSRRLKNIKERTYGSFQNPPDPTDDLLPSLMV